MSAPFVLPASPHATPLAVQIRGARLAFGGVPLFSDLDFQLEAGRWTCLLGPSGIGKSTLLRLIAGLTPTGTGTISAGDGAGLEGRIAWMAQDDLLLPWLDVLGNVTLGARLRQGRAAPGLIELAHVLLRRVGLGHRANERPATLSGGERQRAALVRTLIEDRPIVLMDEPFSALDAITRWRLQAEAASLLRGRTVLLVTHDPREALRLGHRIFIMSGTPARLEAAPCPPGEPLRRPDDETFRRIEAALLGRLVAADSERQPGAGGP